MGWFFVGELILSVVKALYRDCERLGSVQSAARSQIEKPNPRDHDVSVRLNRADCHLDRSGEILPLSQSNTHEIPGMTWNDSPAELTLTCQPYLRPASLA